MEEKPVLEKKFGEAYIKYREEMPAFFTTALLTPILIIAFLISLGILLGWITLTV